MLSTSTPFDAWLSAQAWQQTWWAQTGWLHAAPTAVRAQLRAQRLQQLVERTLRGSPLYARRAGCRRQSGVARAGGIPQLADFAPVDKLELMSAFDDWATDRAVTRRSAEAFVSDPANVGSAWLGRYLVWTSSGTSGYPGLFVQDAASLAAYDALDALRLRPGTVGTAAGWGAGHFAYVGAIGGHYAGHVSLARLQRLLSACGPVPWLPRISLLSVLEPAAEVARQLNRLQPDVLITYPSCAVALAELQADARLRLSLKEIWVGGEQLGPQQRARLQQVFACALRNSYGASEFYSMACACEHGRLHLNDDWVIVEPVDARHRPARSGSFSHHTLITNLANATQPLLRYVLNDRTRLPDERCRCGSTLPLIEVQGRCDDALRLPGRHGGSVTLLPLALESVLEERCGCVQFQLLHLADGSLELRGIASGLSARAPGALFTACRDALRAYLDEQGAAVMRIVDGAKAPVLTSRSGKLRRVVELAAACALSPTRASPARTPRRRAAVRARPSVRPPSRG